jgi:hypothetical protein
MTEDSVKPKTDRNPNGAGQAGKFTPEVREKILQYIRAGAFEWVAAQAAGIGRATFYRWMRDPRAEYQVFADDVRQAHAVVRVTAEVEVRKMDPLAWLRIGPGRSKQDEPGWTEQVAITGPNGGPVQTEQVEPSLDLSKLTDEELAQLRGLQAKITVSLPISADAPAELEQAPVTDAAPVEE